MFVGSDGNGTLCSRILSALLFALSVAALTLDATMALAAAGRTPGTFEVSPTGAATYSVPIWAPPGPHGLQPSIALGYNSQAGNGYIGVGWFLSGLSSISRCNRTFAQDGAPGPVTLTLNDVFCMDGKRLRSATGTYGQANSTYQTEVADFSNVTAYGAAGGGPAYFVVQGRDGRTYTYGNSSTSQITEPGPSGTTAVSWLLNQVSDRAGNTMTISYVVSNGTSVPNVISWVPTTHGANTYAATMTFGYNTNVPVSSLVGYVAGNPIQNTSLLQSITVSYAGSVVKAYFLSYSTNSAVTGRYQLQQIKECADAAASNCLQPSTAFTYQAGSITAGSAVPLGAPADSRTNLYTAYDLNGDGITDLLWFDTITKSWWVAFGGAAGFGTPFNTNVTNSAGTYANGTVGALDGSGSDSLLVQVSNIWWAYKWNPATSQFQGTSTGIAIESVYGASYVLADVNGDGLPDLVTTNSTGGSLHVRLNTSSPGSVSFASTPITTPAGGFLALYATYGAQRHLDFYGTGQEDLFGGNTSGGYVLHFTGSDFVVTALPGGIVDFGDYNDDGCTDILTTVGVLVSACNGQSAGLLPSHFSGMIVGGMDWNGDGRRDVVVSNGGFYSVYLSTGTGFTTTPVATNIPSTTSSGFALGFSAIPNATGDGQYAIVTSQAQAPYPINYYLHGGSGQPPDLLTSAADGFGNSATPGYITLARGVTTTFFPRTDAVSGSGYENYLGPLYVVTNVTYSDPTSTTGATYQQTNYYSGAWMSLRGRGFAGFDAHQTLDSRNGLWRTLKYDLLFPYTGMLIGDVTTQNNSPATTTRSMNGTPACTLLPGGATCPGIVGISTGAYFPYLSNSTILSYELGGSPTAPTRQVSSDSTDYTYDNFGNATIVARTVTDTDANSSYNGYHWAARTVNTTSVNTSYWFLNLFSQTQVGYTSTAPMSNVVTRTKNFTPDTINCRYTNIVTEPGNLTYQATEAFLYDQFGNISSDTLTGVGMGSASPASRTTLLTWSNSSYPTGQLPLSVQDPSGAVNQYTYNYGFGVPASNTDPNGATTSWTYGDGFGRKTLESRPDGTSTLWQYTDCGGFGGCQTGAHGVTFSHTVRDVNGSSITSGSTYFDPLDRAVMADELLPSGSYSRNDLRYDSLGGS